MSSRGRGTAGRSQRNLILTLILIFLPTFIALTFQFLHFVQTTARSGAEFSAAAARDTMAVAAYNGAITLYYYAQEGFENRARRDSLETKAGQVMATLDSLRGAYLGLLGNVHADRRGALLERFNEVWVHYDVLKALAGRVFGPESDPAAERGKPVSAQKAAGRDAFGRGPALIPNVDDFFRRMRERMDDHLRYELAENIVLVQRARESVRELVLRGFVIAFALFALGMVLALIVVRQTRYFQEESTRFQTLLEHSINPIQVISAEGKTIYANPAFERWVNAPLSDLVGRPAFENVRMANAPDRGEPFWETVSPIVRAGNAWSGDVENTRPGQDSSFTLLVISPVLDRAGRLLECISIHHDITERRELARRFEESQEKYQNIVESSLDGIVIVQDGRLVFANSSAVKIFGYASAEEMKELSFSEAVAPSSRFLVFEGYQDRLIGEDILHNAEIKGVTKQGSVIDLGVNAKLVSWNGKPAVQASFRDITERKALERDQAMWLWEQETLSAIDRQLVSSVDFQVVLDAISHHAKSLTRADWAGVMMIDATLGCVRWRAVKGNTVPLPAETFPIGPVSSRVMESRGPVIMEDFGSNPEFPAEEFPLLKQESIVSAARFPLVVDQEIRGQLVVGFRSQRKFSGRELRLLSSLAEKSSIALANAQLYDDLLSRERELEMLSGARVQAQEEERRRIAREIHDSLGQLLTAIKFNVEILEDAANLQGEQELQRVEDIKRLLDSAMAEARQISYNLMPSVLVDFGLVPALQLLCEQFSRGNNLKMNFRSHGINGRLESAMEIGLYRIAQEALNNVAKHAAATEVTVQLIGDEHTIRLTIDDDGRGFVTHRFEPGRAEHRGMGLVGMRERATSFKGTFTLDTQPGRGTEIIVEIPLRQSKEHEADPDTPR